ncbi:hypothetical protein B0H11DRAFT_431718 [Mycena galericulata]|nr:hypothetical protein B0H11DRAFT_431718 [Mycena galericulata]
MVLFLSWIGLASLGFVQAQTLYEIILPTVSPPSPISLAAESNVVTLSEANTFSISAVGVGADGMTTYVEEGTGSALLELQSGLVSTNNQDIVPFTNTFEQDASSMRFGSNDGSDIYGACTYAPSGNAGCVVIESGDTTTYAITFASASAVPFFTINAAAAPTATPSKTAAASGPSVHSNDARAAFKFSTPLTTIVIVLPALLFFVLL